jgi:hypothetical protein
VSSPVRQNYAKQFADWLHNVIIFDSFLLFRSKTDVKPHALLPMFALHKVLIIGGVGAVRQIVLGRRNIRDDASVLGSKE